MGKHLGEIIGGDNMDFDIFSNSSEIIGNYTDYEYVTIGSDKGYYWALSITVLATLLLDFSAGKNLFKQKPNFWCYEYFLKIIF